MAIELVINPGNTMFAEVQARSASTGLFINTAAASVIFRDKQTGAMVSGASWPLPLPYVPGSPGIYRGAIPHSASFVAGRRYEASVSVSTGNNIASWVEDVTAVPRT